MNTKVYRPSRWLWVIPGCFFLIDAFLVFLGIMLTLQPINTNDQYTIPALISLWTLILFFIWVALIFYGLPSQFIELSEEGITCYGGDYRLYTPWHNVAGLGLQPWALKRSLKMLELKELPALNIPLEVGRKQQQAVIEKRWFTLIPIKVVLMQYVRGFPLSMVPKSAWQDGEFGRSLQDFLMAAGANSTTVSSCGEPVRRQELKPTPKRVWWLLIGEVLFSFGMIVLFAKNTHAV